MNYNKLKKREVTYNTMSGLSDTEVIAMWVVGSVSLYALIVMIDIINDWRNKD